jgi:hypothetical protein
MATTARSTSRSLAYRDEGVWQVQGSVPPGSADDIETRVHAPASLARPTPARWRSVKRRRRLLRDRPGDGAPAVADAASDVTAATEWELASGSSTCSTCPSPTTRRTRSPPADLGLLATSASQRWTWACLCDDEDLYPDGRPRRRRPPDRVRVAVPGGGRRRQRVTLERWEPAMRLALGEARLSLGSGDVPVGAVVLGPSGEVVGAGPTYGSSRPIPPGMRRWSPCGRPLLVSAVGG